MLTTLKYINLLKKYFYKKCFLVLFDLQETANVIYLCWGGVLLFDSFYFYTDLKVTLHLQLLQNIGFIPCVV